MACSHGLNLAMLADGTPYMIQGQPAEAIDTLAFVVMAGVVDKTGGKRMMDRISVEPGWRLTVRTMEGVTCQGLGFSKLANTIFWGPTSQTVLAAGLIDHHLYGEYLAHVEYGATRNNRRFGLTVFPLPADVELDGHVLDWEGQPSDAGWVGHWAMFANEPTAFLGLARARQHRHWPG